MKRLLTSSFTSRGLSYLLQSRCKVSVGGSFAKATPVQFQLVRFLSSGDGGDDDKKDISSDPFGVSFDDGENNVGPTSQLPPKYKRDSATGKLTGDVEVELTPEELERLKLGPMERDRLLLKEVVGSWKEGEVDGKTGDPKAMADFARRVRLAKMSLNVLGRSVAAQSAKTPLDDGSEIGRDEETGFTQHLTRSEFESFKKYMKEKYDTDITEDDIPVHSDDATAKKSSPFDEDDIHIQGITDESDADPDNPDLSLKWMTSRAKWEISKRYGAEHPFDEMLPKDLRVQRIVNRKRAKPIPDELMHHNNLGLLRRYVSPAGQIMHRSRTRLGARDQRKVAKLIKRARKLGLIPHSGQFKIECHGDIYEKDLHVKKPWELELERRGLVIKPMDSDKKEGNLE